jgi:hypothetical protein
MFQGYYQKCPVSKSCKHSCLMFAGETWQDLPEQGSALLVNMLKSFCTIVILALAK